MRPGNEEKRCNIQRSRRSLPVVAAQATAVGAVCAFLMGGCPQQQQSSSSVDRLRRPRSFVAVERLVRQLRRAQLAEHAVLELAVVRAAGGGFECFDAERWLAVVFFSRQSAAVRRAAERLELAEQQWRQLRRLAGRWLTRRWLARRRLARRRSLKAAVSPAVGDRVAERQGGQSGRAVRAVARTSSRSACNCPGRPADRRYSDAEHGRPERWRRLQMAARRTAATPRMQAAGGSAAVHRTKVFSEARAAVAVASQSQSAGGGAKAAVPQAAAEPVAAAGGGAAAAAGRRRWRSRAAAGGGAAVVCPTPVAVPLAVVRAVIRLRAVPRAARRAQDLRWRWWRRWDDHRRAHRADRPRTRCLAGRFRWAHPRRAGDHRRSARRSRRFRWRRMAGWRRSSGGAAGGAGGERQGWQRRRQGGAAAVAAVRRAAGQGQGQGQGQGAGSR